MNHAPWLEQAEDDVAAARVLSAANQHSQAVWLASQAVEKAHKAILAALGMRYEEKHFKSLGHATSEIANLLPEALHEPVDPNVATMVTTLETLARSSRYPAPVQRDGPTQLLAPCKRITSSEREVHDAALLLHWCQERVRRALLAVASMRS